MVYFPKDHLKIPEEHTVSEHDSIGMTELMFRDAAEGCLTLEEARRKLHASAYLRPAAETLSRYCGVDPADPARLRKTVTDLLTGSDPSLKKDSVDRKVRSWVNDRIPYISRKSALQLAFALKLPSGEAEEMLWRLCGEGFHRRDPEDIVWLFALEQGMGWTDACALAGRMAPLFRLPEGAAADGESLTGLIREETSRLRTEEELAAYLKENAPRLGALHNTAYQLFTEFMELLKSPGMDDMLPGANRMTAGEIVETYLFNHLIPRGRNGKAGKRGDDALLKDAIQRDIQQNWPDEFALARMASRETDVTRKVLILLFLACDGGETAYGDYSDEDPENVFQDTYTRLGSMLADCGFPPLDARTPFDWMVLYCMVADDLSAIDENIPRFLAGIFQPSAEDIPEA